jgi:mannose-1-phosphate guanylyltransferase/mannose-6-phosphate isomerase
MPNAVTFDDLPSAAAWWRRWLVEDALPLWAGVGVDPTCGGFVECLSVEGAPQTRARRARVQARQAWVYASAARAGLSGPWLSAARAGFDWYVAHYRRADGLFAMLADCDGAVLDETAYVYEQAFSLLALSALHAAGEGGALPLAREIFAALAPLRHPAGGFREAGDQPFQANCHMHLLEACLSWEDVGVDDWRAEADAIAELCLARFIDARDGVLHEFFDADWARLEDGGLIEPGHQFEWAWLLNRWGRSRADDRAITAARRLYANGLKGVDAARGVAVNALWDDFAVRDAQARLWPQTEYVKAALIFGDEAQAVAAAQAMALYLDTPRAGTWRDKLNADATFVSEPAPATSLYHLYGAIAPLLAR